MYTTSTYRKSILASWVKVEGISPLRLLKLTSLHRYEIKELREKKKEEGGINERKLCGAAYICFQVLHKAYVL